MRKTIPPPPDDIPGFGNDVFMLGKNIYWGLIGVSIFFAFFIVALLYMVGNYLDMPSYDFICECNCSKDVTCAFVTSEKTGYVHNNILAAHSTFDPYTFIENSEDSGYFSGYSMQPTLYEGNILLLKNYSKTYKLKPGEIIRYSTISNNICKSLVPLNVESPYVVHRIKAIYDLDEIHVQGDNNQYSEIIRDCQITHIVVGVLYR